MLKNWEGQFGKNKLELAKTRRNRLQRKILGKDNPIVKRTPVEEEVINVPLAKGRVLLAPIFLNSKIQVALLQSNFNQ